MSEGADTLIKTHYWGTIRIMSALYRSFTNAPSWTRDGSGDPSNTDDWLQWMEDESLIHDFLPQPAGSCRFCGTGLKDGFNYCFQCRSARQFLDALVPLSYSIDNGLESLVKSYKDFDRPWTAAPLASLLAEGFGKHGDCILGAVGDDAIYTWVPSNDAVRGFDHLERLVNSPSNVASLPWMKGVVERNRALDRPRPGRDRQLIVPEAYDVRMRVADRNVLLFDDLWTSGASMGSTAAALKEAGAAKVVGLVLGRQLRRDNSYGNSEEVFTEVEKRGWSLDECSLCA